MSTEGGQDSMIPIAYEHLKQPDWGFQTPLPTKRNQCSLEEWLTPGLTEAIYRMNLKNCNYGIFLTVYFKECKLSL